MLSTTKGSSCRAGIAHWQPLDGSLHCALYLDGVFRACILERHPRFDSGLVISRAQHVDQEVQRLGSRDHLKELDDRHEPPACAPPSSGRERWRPSEPCRAPSMALAWGLRSILRVVSRMVRSA